MLDNSSDTSSSEEDCNKESWVIPKVSSGEHIYQFEKMALLILVPNPP